MQGTSLKLQGTAGYDYHWQLTADAWWVQVTAAACEQGLEPGADGEWRVTCDLLNVLAEWLEETLQAGCDVGGVELGRQQAPGVSGDIEVGEAEEKGSWA